MKLASLIWIARETISILDEFPDLTLLHAEIHAAAKAGELVDHLNTRFREKPHLPVLLANLDERLAVNHALRRAAETMELPQFRRTVIRNSGPGLLMALILDAIREHYLDPCPAVTLRH